MRRSLVLAAILAGATATLSAQTAQTSTSSGVKAAASQPLTLNGVIISNISGATATPFLFTDHTDDTTHRLSRWNLATASDWFTHAVIFVDTPQLRVAGGLTPSPDVAAQAGAIDPAKAAVAALSGGPATWFGDGEPDAERNRQR